MPPVPLVIGAGDPICAAETDWVVISGGSDLAEDVADLESSSEPNMSPKATRAF